MRDKGAFYLLRSAYAVSGVLIYSNQFAAESCGVTEDSVQHLHLPVLGCARRFPGFRTKKGGSFAS
jgi:hypothetical protein